MSSKPFCTLIDEICALSGLSQPDLFYERADLMIEDIGFSLLESPEQGLFWLCDFGTLPVTELRAAVLQRLLETNYFSYGLHTPVFGVNYDTERVLLMGRLPMESANAEALLRSFGEHAAMAKEWRRAYLLVAPGQPLPTTAIKSSRHWMFQNAPAGHQHH